MARLEWDPSPDTGDTRIDRERSRATGLPVETLDARLREYASGSER